MNTRSARGQLGETVSRSRWNQVAPADVHITPTPRRPSLETALPRRRATVVLADSPGFHAGTASQPSTSSQQHASQRDGGRNTERSGPAIARSSLGTQLRVASRDVGSAPRCSAGTSTQRPKHKNIFTAFTESRPFFVSYLMLVQTISVATILAVYPLAPCSLSVETSTGEVTDPYGFTVVMSRNTSPNMYLGPTYQDLVLLGAKYGPCTRRFDSVYNLAQKVQSNATLGCCVSSTALGPQCFTTEESGCDAAIGRQWISSACDGPVCCDNPSAHPQCSRLDSGSFNATQLAVCTCTVVARPCCTGVPPTCSIRTKSACEFLRGHYHNDAALCSDIDCVESICGLSEFSKKGQPDQWYRLLVAPFLPAGILHLVLMLVAEMHFVYELEKVIGWWRVGVLFLGSCSGAYLFSTIVAPHQVQCGASPGVLGLLACLYVELFHSWDEIVRPVKESINLLLLVVVTLGIGLLPQVDNIANGAGFVIGVLIGLAVLPRRSVRRWSRARRQIVQLLSGGVLFIYAIVGFSSLYSRSDDGSCQSSTCQGVSCMDIKKDWCAATGQRSP